MMAAATTASPNRSPQSARPLLVVTMVAEPFS